MHAVNQLMVSLLVILLAFDCQASDKAKEKRWADQIADFVVVGEPVWLQAGDDKFLGLYTEAEEEASGAVIILHGIGVHPDWEDVVQPLRSQLPDKGWTTLSIQMPVLANEAEMGEYAPLFKEVPPRVKAAVDYLHSNEYKNIVLIGHSLGTEMGAYYLTTDASASKNIRSFVAISMGAPRPESISGIDMIAMLKKISIPVFDLYGKTHENAFKGAGQRLAVLRTDNGSRQRGIDGAGHFFRGKNSELVNAVSEWLDGHRDK